MLESGTPKRDKSKKGENKKQAKRVWAFNALLGRLKGLNLKADVNDNPGDGVCYAFCFAIQLQALVGFFVGRKEKIALWPEPASVKLPYETVDVFGGFLHRRFSIRTTGALATSTVWPLSQQNTSLFEIWIKKRPKMK